MPKSNTKSRISSRHYGWHRGPRDRKTRRYAVGWQLSLALPPRVELPSPGPIWHQGDIGSCGAQSAARDLVFAALHQDNFREVPTPSRLFIYWCARNVMGTTREDSGVDNLALMKALQLYGWCDEADWPYDVRRFREPPPPEIHQKARQHCIGEYWKVEQRLDVMKGAVASGDGFIFGFDVYPEFESNEVADSGMVPMPRGWFSRSVGGHDVWLRGYDDTVRCPGARSPGAFLCDNSWGAEWGQQGSFWIAYEYACNPRLASDFYTIKNSYFPGEVVPAGPSGLSLFGWSVESMIHPRDGREGFFIWQGDKAA